MIIENITCQTDRKIKGGKEFGTVDDLKLRNINTDIKGNTCPALTAVGSELIYRIDSPYRIRKLTPMECWRLMDFSDQDFYKAEAVNSNTQLYKQAGNSIVRNVLVAIFGQMLPGKEDDYKKGA